MSSFLTRYMDILQLSLIFTVTVKCYDPRHFCWKKVVAFLHFHGCPEVFFGVQSFDLAHSG